MKKILLIEDDIALRENTAELLELSSYEVITAPNGKIGIEKAFQLRPDVIVCDIMMPEIDGYGVLNAISSNSKTSNIPFIFLSAKTEHKEIRKGMDLGADDYLTKPFDELELINAIESRLAKAQILQHSDRQHNFSESEENLNTLNQFKNLICDEGEILKFKKDTIIYEQGQHSNNIYLILKGVVKSFSINSNGKELITSLYKADDFLGLDSFDENVSYSDSAMSVENVELASISKKYMKLILKQNQDISIELLELFTTNLSDAKQKLIEMAYGSVRKKTARTIVAFVEIMNKNPAEAIRISRNDLAATAGIAPESLIRTISDFKREGIIEIEGRNIQILNIEKLRSIE